MVVETRSRCGDYEVDTMSGEGNVELFWSWKILNPGSLCCPPSAIEVLNWVKHLYTITSDNWKEFANHQSFSTTLSAKIFFAHPYAAWERGANENTNGLIRQYIPKNRDLDTITTEEELWITDRLNLRPRKCLDYSNPFEIFFGLTIALTSWI